MNGPRARRVAHGLWLTTGALWVTAMALVIAGSPNVGNDLVIGVVGAIPMVVYGSVGALVARTRPEDPIGWLLAWVGLAHQYRPSLETPFYPERALSHHAENVVSREVGLSNDDA